MMQKFSFDWMINDIVTNGLSKDALKAIALIIVLNGIQVGFSVFIVLALIIAVASLF